MSVRAGAEVTGMIGPAALPRRNGELAFEAPWQGRAFAMALAVIERLDLPWSEFQRRLIDQIRLDGDAPYWDCWMGALERLVVEHGVLTDDEITGACSERRVDSD